MTDIYAQPGTEKYVKWAKAKLVGLRNLRTDIRLDVMQKHFVPVDGVRIDIMSSSAGDRIRIFGGGLWPVALTLPEPPATYIIREFLESDLYLPEGGGPLPHFSGTLLSGRVDLVVGYDAGLLGGTVIESYAGTKDIFSGFYVDHTEQTITYTTYPGSSLIVEPVSAGQQIDGVFFSSTGPGSFDDTVISAIPNFGDAATAAATRSITEWMESGDLTEDWKTELIAGDPFDDERPFTKVILIPFEAVKAGVLQGMYPSPTPTDVTEIQIYGVATHEYDPETEEFTFVGWEPASETTGYIRIPFPTDPVGLTFPDENFMVNYSLPRKGDVPLAAAARTALKQNEPVKYAIMKAVHQI